MVKELIYDSYAVAYAEQLSFDYLDTCECMA